MADRLPRTRPQVAGAGVSRQVPSPTPAWPKINYLRADPGRPGTAEHEMSSGWQEPRKTQKIHLTTYNQLLWLYYESDGQRDS